MSKAYAQPAEDRYDVAELDAWTAANARARRAYYNHQFRLSLTDPARIQRLKNAAYAATRRKKMKGTIT